MDITNSINIYYDHYKESCSHNLIMQNRRNKSFVILCILETISLLMTRSPDMICSLLNDATLNKFETSIRISDSVIQSLLWILICYVLIRYIQDSLNVERQYRYIYDLEIKISEILDERSDLRLFSREGDYYAVNYSMVQNIIDLFYKMFTPFLFSVINVVHIVSESRMQLSHIFIICDIAVCSFIILITGFYFFHIHNKIGAFFMKCPIIRVLVIYTQKILKEV